MNLLSRRLDEIYKTKNARLANFGVKGQDLKAEYAPRTRLYDEAAPPLKPRNGEVNPAVAVTQCSACGLRSFYGADGTPMKPCHLCGEAYYCDATCAACDAPAHALVCAHARGRAKWPTKLATCWVQSRATTVARAALRRRPKPSVEEVSGFVGWFLLC